MAGNYDLSKVMSLADGQVMYKDLRDRIKNIPVPEVPVVGLLINGLVMPITENKYIKFGVQNGVKLVMNGSGTGFDLEADIRDIQVNGTSVLQNGVANIPEIPDITSIITNPSVKSAGDFLVFNGTNWVAQSLAVWQGGNY